MPKKPDGYSSVSPYLVVGGAELRRCDPGRRGGVKDPAGATWWIATQAASS